MANIIQSNSKIKVRKAMIPYSFLLPYVILTGIFFLYPFLNSIFLAFHQTSGPKSSVFVGLANFRFVLGDPDFLTAVKNTSIFALTSIFIQLPLSLGLAMLLNSKTGKMKGIFRLIIFSPRLVGRIFVGILFSVLYMPKYGMFNKFMHSLIHWGLLEQWLTNPSLVMPALVMTALWLNVGFNMIYFLAALQNVDQNLVEASVIDGAGPWQVFRYVTLPQIKPVAIFVVIISTIGSFQLFELPYALLGGFGPKNAGLTIVGYLYNSAFNIGDLGTGAAIGWILAIIIFTISMVQMKITGAIRD